MSTAINDDVIVPVADIVKELQSLKDVKTVDITDFQVKGSLANIVPYCKSVSHLRIEINPNENIKQYESFGRLSELKQFYIIGQHEPGTLQPFFLQAAKSNISILTLEDAELNPDEVSLMTSMKSLQVLTCGFSDPQSVGLLAKMDNLKDVSITTPLNFDIAIQVVAILKETKQEMRIDLTHEESGLCLDWNLQRLIIYLPRYDPIDLSWFASLSEIPEIKYFTIQGTHQNGSLLELLRGFGGKEPKKLEELVIYNKSWLTSEETAALAFIKSLKSVECGFLSSVNMEKIANLTDLQEFCISSRPKEESLCKLLMALSSMEEQTLQYFYSPVGTLGYDETEELANIKSLKYLSCKFSHVEALEQLENMPNLEYAFFSVRQKEYNVVQQAGRLLKFLKSCQKKAQIEFRGCDVTYSKSEGLLVVEFKEKKAGGILCSQLGLLGNIRSLQIIDRPKIGNLENLLKGVLHYNEVESLEIDELQEEEIPIVAQMDSLSKLTVGFSDQRNINLLARLPHLTYLCVTKHPSGELEDLLCDLALRMPPVELDTLSILGNYLRSEEIVQLAKISSLRSLRCGLFDPYDNRALTELAEISMLEELDIVSYITGSMVKLFKALRRMKQLHRLVVRGCPLISKEVVAIKKLRFLRTLHCTLADATDIEILSRAPKLEELLIYSIYVITSNFLAPLAKKQPQTLKKLIIKFRSLGEGELNTLAWLKSLEHLNCIVHSELNLHNLAFLNLKELTLECCKEISIENFLKELVARKEHVLCSFDLRNQLLIFRSTQLLVQINSLRKLKIGFKDQESFDLLTQLTELEVLEIKKKTYHVNQILSILTCCRKLREIIFVESDIHINTEFIGQCLDVLKSVRNPEEHKPLQMYLHEMCCVSTDQKYNVDQSYLTLNLIKRPLFDEYNDEIVYPRSVNSSESEEDSSESSEETSFEST
ncbi:uncharacterized protein LOC108089286 [Drosophila ficusphila]|uniref:uncharacterized protein LOC108089286 n=1 Tax=Drosophila ficusphila TaxID=30025 RepID=UPI0007E7B8E7|nr:uncharacterized protein LOC108089286 [Drosophila ficusphila]